MMRRLFKFPWRTARDIGADVDAELLFHIEERTRELTASGLAPDAARTEALRLAVGPMSTLSVHTESK
jgi:hypothetical protein